MKYFFRLVFLLVLSTGCKQKRLPQAALQNKLMLTMKDFLVKSSKPGVVVTVKDVYFYAEKNYYSCEFHVNMRSDNKDTTGTMSATISKDFGTVKRSQ